jgi:fumarate reductase subunit D
MGVMQSISSRCLITLGVLGLVALIVGWILKSYTGLYAALVAIVILLVFCLTTPVTMVVVAKKKSSSKMSLATLGITWILKFAIVVVALVIVRSMTWYDHWLLVIFIVVGAIVMLAVEAFTVLRSRVPYIDMSKTVPSSPDEQGDEDETGDGSAKD